MRQSTFSLIFIVFGTVLTTIFCLEWLNRETPFMAEALAQTRIVDLEYHKGLTEEEKRNILLYENASKSVVNIDTQSRVNTFFMERVAQGMGSGGSVPCSGKRSVYAAGESAVFEQRRRCAKQCRCGCDHHGL